MGDEIDNIKDINDDDKALDAIAAKKTAEERAAALLEELKKKDK